MDLPQGFLLYVGVGFAAQLIDGALGMAYGVTASSLLLSMGLSHRAFGNVDRRLFRSLLVPGILGAVAGATILASFPGDTLKPYVAAYLLLMGAIIIFKGFREFPPRTVTTHLGPLGFFGALIDAMGGGGWGPVVASTLVARGNDLRQTVGSVNAVEFFVTLASSITFILMLGLTHWAIILGLALGGLVAAPLAAWACTRIPLRPFMFAVGLLVIALSLRTLLRYYHLA